MLNPGSGVLALTIPDWPAFLPILGAGALVAALASRNLKQFAVVLMVGGWGLFALTSPSAQFPTFLRPLAVAVCSAGAILHALQTGPRARVRTTPRRIALPSRFIVIYVVFVALGCMVSPNGPRNLIRWVQGVAIIMSCFYAVAVALTDHLLMVTFAACSANVFLSVISRQQELTYEGYPNGRLAGHMNPNHLAFTAAEVLIGLIFLLPRRPHLTLPFLGRVSMRVPLVMNGLIAAYALYATRSRTGLIAFVIAALIAWFAGEHVRGARTKVVIRVVAVALVLGPLAAPAIGSYLNRDSSTDSITSLTGRTDFWPVAVDLIEQRPIIGWGVNVILSPAGKKFQEILPGVGQAHNAFLEAALQAGIIGATAWALSLIGVMIGSFRLPRSDTYRSLLITFSILLVFSSVTESSPAWFGDMFIAYIMCAAIYSERLQLVPTRVTTRRQRALVAT
jgi:O-antigen ligase